MTILATALRQLIAAGVAGDDLVLAVAELEAALPVRDAAAERRRARDRAYQARKRQRAESAESADSAVSAEPISPNDIILTPSVNPDVSDETSFPSAFENQVVTAWNAAIAGTPLPKARALTRDRRRHLAARVREHGRAAVAQAIANMVASDFHSGRSGKWLEGNLGWLLRKPETFARMLERVPPPAHADPPPAADRADSAERMAAIYEQQGRGDEARMLRREAEMLRSKGDAR